MFFASDRWFHTFFASGSAIFCSQKMQPTSYLWQLGWLFCLHFNTFHSWLVVSNMFYCPFHIWDVILPIDSYFSSWLKPPTRESHVLDPGPGLNSQFVFSHPQKWDPKNGRSLPPGSVLRPAVASALDALLKRLKHNRSRERWTSQPRRAGLHRDRQLHRVSLKQSLHGLMPVVNPTWNELGWAVVELAVRPLIGFFDKVVCCHGAFR